ncbi:hypothetical protein GJ496_008215 [Pomphorhynchus laevis]|nr:hypothetical protein GJ496_008215 [Pomphorhynchus laevis]
MEHKSIEQLSLIDATNHTRANDKAVLKSDGSIVLDTHKEELMDIPTCEFIDDLEKYVSTDGRNPKEILKDMTTLLKKYKVMAENVEKRISKLSNVTMVELKESTRILEELCVKQTQNKDLTTDFRLWGNVRLKAVIPPVKKVGIWLGASVMVEYTLEEAKNVIMTSTTNVQNALEKCNLNLANLKRQITTLEVSIARIHNFAVTAGRSSSNS